MNILLVGNGGREHAICAALARSLRKPNIINIGTAHNPGIEKLASEIIIADINDAEKIASLAAEKQIDFAVIGPENPLESGVADALYSVGIPSFGPTKACAQLESSKSFTRNLLQKYDIDASPAFEVFDAAADIEKMRAFYDQLEGQIVVKADGLIGGKGVLVAGDHFTDFQQAEAFALQSIEKFGRVVFEEKMVGPEFSLISIVDGKTVLDCIAVKDHKRAFEGDTGPNTGGMGTISDERGSLPFLDSDDLKTAHEITVQTLAALGQELDQRYIGVMYGGFMKTKNGVRLIEYNARFGDPEALNILPLLETDFVDLCQHAIDGTLDQLGSLKFKSQATVVKYLCPEGYPTSPVKNVEISVEDYADTDQACAFFASVAQEDGKFILKGSRAVGIVGIGYDLERANKNCEQLIEKFSGPLFYRKDIGASTNK